MHEEHPFTLPRGLRLPGGELCREGAMRPATAGDEILPLEDPRVRGNRAYLVLLLLSRVITRLGPLGGPGGGPPVTAEVLEGLYTADLAYLQDRYREVNGLDPEERTVACPHCGKSFPLAG